jgi:hypothetical protein
VHNNKKREGCSLKQPKFGLPAEGKKRWCSGCAKAHAGAVDVVSKKSEGYGLKRPNFGLPAKGKKRWCAGCAKRHTPGVVAVAPGPTRVSGHTGHAKRKAADEKAAPKKQKATDKKKAVPKNK